VVKVREIRKPAPLAKGDTIGVVAPASWPAVEKAEKAAKLFENLGLRVQFGQSLSRKHGYLAGTDEQRIEELHRMFADPNIKGIFCACGGYGTGRIASRLDYGLIEANPKVFWGYSDITFLLNAIFQRTGLVTFHGPMLSSDLGEDDIHPVTLQSLQQVIEPRHVCYTEEISPLQAVVEGEATGTIVGGNLTLLTSTLGTPFEIDTRGKLLFLEDVDEEPYRIDRMLNQLKMAGKLDEAAGILLCDFNNCVPMKRKESLTLEQLFADYIKPTGKPAMAGFKIGHCSPHVAIPIGVKGRLSTFTKEFAIEEAGIAVQEPSAEENGGIHENTAN
jgi:muramoyltetrapeptide carboxypeptidase